MSTPGCSTSASPVAPSPVTMLTTPGGRPASRQISAKASAVSGVNSAGFSTTVLPAASAGAIFQASISSGKFQGMIWPQTPTGAVARELALDQLGPAGVMVEVAGDQRDVDVARFADRLAVVQRLQHGEEALVLLHLAGERVEIARALMARRAPTRPAKALRAAATARVDVGGGRLAPPASDALAVAGLDDVERARPGFVKAPSMKWPKPASCAVEPGRRHARRPSGEGP